MQLIPEIGVKVGDKLPSETTDQAADMEVSENPTLQNAVDDKLPGKVEGCALNGICEEKSPPVAKQEIDADESMEVDQIEDTVANITEKQTNQKEIVEDDAPLLNDVMVMIADLDQELLTSDNQSEETSKKISTLEEIEIEKSLLASPTKIEKMDCDDSVVCDSIDEKDDEIPKSPMPNEEPVSENFKDPFDKQESVPDPAFKDSDKSIDKDIVNIPEKDSTIKMVSSNNIDIRDDATSINGIVDAIEVESSQETPPVINSPVVNPVTTDVSFEISDDEIDVIKKKVIEVVKEIADNIELEEKVNEDEVAVVKEKVIEDDKIEVVKEKVIEDDKVEVVKEKVIEDDKVEVVKEKAIKDDKVEVVEKVIEDDKVEVLEKAIEGDKVEVIEEKTIDNDKVEDFTEKVIEDDTIIVVKNTNENANEHNKEENKSERPMCIDDDDDDDIVLIDDSTKGDKTEVTSLIENTNANDTSKMPDTMEKDKDSTGNTSPESTLGSNNGKEKNTLANAEEICPWKFMKEIQPALGEMTRVDFEEFCVVKVVEGIAGRSALSDLRLKLKAYEKSMEEWRKKVINLNKQNKDLQIVLKTVCDEQQKRTVEKPVPIKITRSVGLQVGFPSINKDKNEQINSTPKANAPPSAPAPAASLRTRGRVSKASVPSVANPTTTTSSPIAPQKSTPVKKNNNVPIPRLVPTTSSLPNSSKATTKTQPSAPLAAASNGLLKSALSNDVKPIAEKRSAIQSIDLTDDEPPAKQTALKTLARSPQQAFRPVNTQQLTNPNPRVTTYVVNAGLSGSTGPRQVFIPISAQGQPVGPNSVMVPRKMLPNKNTPGIRNFGPLSQQNQAIRIGQAIPIRPNNMYTNTYQHPAPLPQSVNSKALMNSGFKWIPPKPSLKIARVDNGIVISWEMEDFSESQHEIIASYQIYAYQEASTQPSTDLWKKIGDVKALPLPMACTLTHFMAGFKYYFAVRAIDIHRRVGPFSSPGNIMLLSNKS